LGATPAVIHDAILNRAPTPPLRVNAELPPELERMINKALEKDREIRYQVASELRADLKRLKRDTDSGHSAVGIFNTEEAAVEHFPQRMRRNTWVLALGGTAVVATAIIFYLLARPVPAPRLTGSVQITNDGRAKYAPTLTDGSRLYYMVGLGRRNRPFPLLGLLAFRLTVPSCWYRFLRELFQKCLS
jgi:hypothetical protein